MLPGTEVDFIAGRQALEIKPRSQAQISSKAFDLWMSKAAGSARPGISTDEHMAIPRDARRYRTYFPDVKLICP